jgi:hypothetical protein
MLIFCSFLRFNFSFTERSLLTVVDFPLCPKASSILKAHSLLKNYFSTESGLDSPSFKNLKKTAVGDFWMAHSGMKAPYLTFTKSGLAKWRVTSR